MSEGMFKRRIREERLKAIRAATPAICTHLTIEECVENDCGIEYVYKVLEEARKEWLEIPSKVQTAIDNLPENFFIHHSDIFNHVHNALAVEKQNWLERWLGFK